MPASKAGPFKKSICSHIQAYLELKKSKRAQACPAVDRELRAIGTRVKKALRLASAKAPRHREFRLTVEDISACLRDLSHDARDYLAGRGQKVIVAPPDAPSDPALSPDLVDPHCYGAREQQLAALQSLGGSLFWPHARPRERGRPRKDHERFLHAMLAASFAKATEKSPNEKSRRFMEMCEALAKRCQLVDYRPESRSRGSRKRRKGTA